ncbi:MAG: hypothetical protein RUMPE_01332 [Eubacteriales bacterium SKADARSKE-1]|nr:hypothetical protein [Eubacteriales bacterium SKADARSKE-1]
MSTITVSNLNFAYDGSYDNIFENVSFTLDTNLNCTPKVR